MAGKSEPCPLPKITIMDSKIIIRYNNEDFITVKLVIYRNINPRNGIQVFP